MITHDGDETFDFDAAYEQERAEAETRFIEEVREEIRVLALAINNVDDEEIVSKMKEDFFWQFGKNALECAEEKALIAAKE